MLAANVKEFLGKILGIQQGIGGRKWNSLCAVSNSCILHRDNIPKAINKSVIKSEAIAEAVQAIGDKRIVGKVFGGDPAFTDDEMTNIANFVYSQATNANEVSEISENPKPKILFQPKKVINRTSKPDVSLQKPQEKEAVTCKKCGETEELDDLYGQYGYYVKCRKCGTNTSMKIACFQCGNKKVKLSKKKRDYFLSCDCSESYVIFSQSSAN